jgi:hypothetical protein
LSAGKVSDRNFKPAYRMCSLRHKVLLMKMWAFNYGGVCGAVKWLLVRLDRRCWSPSKMLFAAID